MRRDVKFGIDFVMFGYSLPVRWSQRLDMSKEAAQPQ